MRIMRIPLQPPYVTISLRSRAYVHLVLREVVRQQPVGTPSWGSDLWFMGDGSLQIEGVGLRLTNVMRGSLVNTYGPDLRDLGVIGATIARDLDTRTSAAGLNLPVKQILAFANQQPGYADHVELGGVGAGVCFFYPRPGGDIEILVPPRPAPRDGRPLAPITRVAQERWDANWTPANVAALHALLDETVAAGMSRLRTKLRSLPGEFVF